MKQLKPETKLASIKQSGSSSPSGEQSATTGKEIQSAANRARKRGGTGHVGTSGGNS